MFNYFKDDAAGFPRMYNFVNELRKNHHIVVLQPLRLKSQEEKKLKQKTRIYYYPEQVIANRKLWYFTDFNFKLLQIARNIVKTEKIDLVQLDYPYGGVLLSRFLNVPLLYNSQNIESQYYRDVGRNDISLPTVFRHFLPIYIYILEFFVCRLARLVLNISMVEKEKMSRLYHIHSNKFIAISNGVPDKYAKNPLSKEEAVSFLHLDPKKRYILFHGGYMAANKEAYHYITQRIAPSLRERNDIAFLFAGNTPKFQGKNILTLGFLDDLKPFLYAGTLAVIPILRGAGVRTKILDYIAARIPFISTSKGVEGLDLVEGLHYLNCNNIEEYSEKINILLKNNGLKTTLCDNLQTIAAKKFNWFIIGKTIEYIYQYIVLNKH